MVDDRGLPTWRYGLPPMLYPTHCVGLIVPVMRERMSEVTCIGWGDGHEVLRTNQYNNPFWNETAFFRTANGHSARVSICWHAAVGSTERGQFLGDRLSYFMERPEGTPDTVVRIAQQGKTVLDSNGYPEGDVQMKPDTSSNYTERPARAAALHPERPRQFAHLPHPTNSSAPCVKIATPR